MGHILGILQVVLQVRLVLRLLLLAGNREVCLGYCEVASIFLKFHGMVCPRSDLQIHNYIFCIVPNRSREGLLSNAFDNIGEFL